MTKRNVIKFNPNQGTARQAFDIVEASRNNKLSEVQAALEDNPACINARGEADFTALHWACSNRNAAICALLLSQRTVRPDLDAQDIRGNRPVDLAMARRADALVTLLLQSMYSD